MVDWGLSIKWLESEISLCMSDHIYTLTPLWLYINHIFEKNEKFCATFCAKESVKRRRLLKILPDSKIFNLCITHFFVTLSLNKYC